MEAPFLAKISDSGRELPDVSSAAVAIEKNLMIVVAANRDRVRRGRIVLRSRKDVASPGWRNCVSTTDPLICIIALGD